MQKTVELPSGQTVNVTVKYGPEEILRRVKVHDGKNYRNIRAADRSLVVSPIQVQGCRLTVSFSNGSTLEARSCCKPPDVFSHYKARKLALRRLFRIDSGWDLRLGRKVTQNVPPRLPDDDRKALFYAVVPNNLKVRKPKETQPEPPAAVG